MSLLGAFRCTASRPFSNCASLAGVKKPKNLIPTSELSKIPPYPYGRARWYKQSNKGLYGGSTIQFGNNVSDRTENKTRRSWSPNVQEKSLFSVALNERVKVRVTMRVLRTIDKVGGLDEYLLGEKPARVKELGETGWKLRWRLLQTNAVKKRLAAQAKELGLSDSVIRERQWLTKSQETQSESIQVKEDGASEIFPTTAATDAQSVTA